MPSLREKKNENLRERKAKLLWNHMQNLFSYSSSAVFCFVLCPASLYPVSCLGCPVSVELC